MQRQNWFPKIFVIGLIFAPDGRSAETVTQPDWKVELTRLRSTVEDLEREISILRKTLAELQLERHRETIRQIRTELGNLAAERTRIAELDRVRQQDLGDVEELLTRDTGPGDKSGAELVRNELAVTRMREISEQSEAIGTREDELLRRLQTEEQAARRIEEAWKTTKGKGQ